VVSATLTWSGSANLDLFLTSPDGVGVANSVSAGTPETVLYVTPAGGRYSFGVKATTGTASYTLDVTTDPYTSAGDAGAYSGTLAAGASLSHPVSFGAAGLTVATLDWPETTANLHVFLKNASGTQVAKATTAGRPEILAYRVPAAGSYTLTVSAATGSATYSLGVEGPPGAPPPPATPGAYASQYGFSGPAGTYPYGLEHDASSDTLLVADYWNNRVKRFSSDGSQYLGVVSKNAPKDAPGGICTPYDVEADPDGNFFVADENCSRVVQFAPDGTWVRTFGRGGTPNYGFGCGGGKLNVPTYVYVSPASRKVFVSDPKCGTVYIYAADGTYVGEFDWSAAGLPGPPKARGLDGDAQRNIYVADFSTKRIVVFDEAGQYRRQFEGRPDMNDVRGLAVDQTNNLVYTVGAYYNRVFQFTTAGTFVRKWGGSGDTEFVSARYPAVDGSGALYVSDTWGYRVWKFDQAGQPLPWNQAPEPPPDGGFNLNMGVTIDPEGTVYVIDTYEQRVQAFDSTKTCAGLGNCPAWKYAFGERKIDIFHPGGFAYPRALTYSGGYLWAGDNNNAVIKYLPDGTFVQRIGSQGTGSGQFLGGVMGVEYVNDLLYATDVTNCRLQIFDANGVFQSKMGTCGTAAGQMRDPRGISVRGNLVYVAEVLNNRISVWDTTTKSVVRTFRPTCDGLSILGPIDVELDPAGTKVYIADTNNKRIVRVAPDGTGCEVVTRGSDTPTGQLGNPRYLQFGGDGRLYVSTSARRIYSFSIAS